MKLVTLFTLIFLAALSCPATSEKNKTKQTATNGKHVYDDKDSYSPIVLNRQWNTLFRLTILVLGTIIGLTMDGYFVTTFFIARPVKKIGNVFLVCAGLANCVTTGGAMFLCDVALISSREWDTPEVCRVVQTLVTASAYCYSMFFIFVAIVARCRVNRSRKIFQKCLPALVCVICVTVFLFGFTLAGIGTFLGLDHDYCKREHTGNYWFRMGSGTIHILSFCITVPVLISSIYKLKHHNRGNGQYKRSYQFQRDMTLMKVNLFLYLLYVVFWIPYLLVVNFYPDAPAHLFYITAYVAVSRALLPSSIYGLCSQPFDKSYSAIFKYCWCKTSLNNFRSRQVKPGNGNSSRPLDVRTHILLQPLSQSAKEIGSHDEL